MKITVILLFCGFLNLFAGPGYSQSTKISLNMQGATIESVLNEIEEISEFYFLFNHKLIDVNRKVDVTADKEPISDILSEIFRKDVRFIVSDRQVVLVPVEGSGKLIYLLQQQIVTGKITDAMTGEAMQGVNIQVKGTSLGTNTNNSGEYSISVPDINATLVFSFIGYRSQEVPLAGRTILNINLENEMLSLEEVVVVGYGTQRKSEMTVAVSQVKGKLLESIPKVSIMESLGGRLAGIDVISSSGAPGAGSTIRIRGANSVNSGADPLYVIDGFPIAVNTDDLAAWSRMGLAGDKTDIMSMINPNDIESIEFLKDAAATSIYGARGANGVILITTKLGKVGKSDITFSANTGIQTIAKKWDLLNANEFSSLLYDAYSRGGIDMQNLAYDPAKGLAIPVDYDTDWVDEILQMGVVQDYNLSFSGASEKGAYSGSVGYLDNKGIIRSNTYKRYTARLNADIKALDGRFKMGINTNFSYVDQKTIPNNSVWDNAMSIAPNYPVRFPEGKQYAGHLCTYSNVGAYDILWGKSYGVSSSNALTSGSPLYYTDIISAPNNIARIILNGYMSIEPVKGLTFKSSLGTDLNYSKAKYLAPSYGPYMLTGASLEHKQNQTYSWSVENTMTYIKTFDKHKISFLLGQSSQKFYGEGVGIATAEPHPGQDYINNNPFFVDGGSFNNGVNDRLTDTHKFATVMGWTVASYFTRLNYSFNDKYLLTATVRRDGSSKFGKNNKWGNFPGLSVAWNLHNEDFFNIAHVDQLKIRGSWGIVGNGNISSYLSQALIAAKPSMAIGVIVAGTGKYESGLVDPALSWESTREIDFGFDSYIFNNISITADIYWKRTFDLLYGRDLPYTTGFSSIGTTNLGAIEQFGAELSISGDIIKQKQKGDFNWNATVNIDHLHGKITELPVGVNYVGDNIRSYVNKPIGVIYGYIVDGIYNLPEELSDPNNPYPSAQLGDYKYRDVGSVDEKGKFVSVQDNMITAADRTDLGNVNPLFNFGLNNTFSYKGFDLSVFFRGSVGNKIYNQAKRNLLNTNGKQNTIKEALDRWTPANNSQTIQAANSNRKDPTGSSPLSLFVEDGSYLRLANLTLGYSLPNRFMREIGIQSIRVYGSVNNLFVITGYSGLDPEVSGSDKLVPRGIDDSAYPKTRTFTLGLNLRF